MLEWRPEPVKPGKYRIDLDGAEYVVTDPWNERVGVYETKEATQAAINENVEEDTRWQAAKILFDIAVKTLTCRATIRCRHSNPRHHPNAYCLLCRQRPGYCSTAFRAPRHSGTVRPGYSRGLSLRLQWPDG
jgi:hypothetical protein